MDSQAFCLTLKSRGLRFFAGVPDSTFGRTYDAIAKDPEIRYVPAVREDVALGVASACYFAGSLGGVLMQNSGLGNVINPLTSFNLLYKVPALLVVGWRGIGGEPNDAPEHWIMGAKTAEMLDLLGVPCEILDGEGAETKLDRLLATIEGMSIPGVLLVPPEVLE